MRSYVTDTHALIWYLIGSPKLGENARQIFDSAVRGENRILIPAIVVAEMIMFAEKYRTIDPKKIWATLEEHSGFLFVPLQVETVKSIQELVILPDIHDRLIVAETMEQKAVLITLDGPVTESGLVKIIW